MTWLCEHEGAIFFKQSDVLPEASMHIVKIQVTVNERRLSCQDWLELRYVYVHTTYLVYFWGKLLAGLASELPELKELLPKIMEELGKNPSV
jgi:hypothetical protein